MQPLARSLSIALLVGTVLLGAGAALHPILPHDPAEQLRMIADTWYFRPIHLAMLAGSALIILGIWTRALIGPPSPPLLAALALVSLGLCFNAIDIAVMASAGTQLATLAQAGQAGMGTLFDSLHRVGLMTARFGNLLVALGAIVLSWVERQENPNAPWPSRLAWIAGAVGLFCVICFPEASLAILAAVTLLAGWQLSTAVRGMRMR
ncbi:MAG: hypothetical protein ACJ79A_02840 [Gemmatimonadaceae bacterium]